ncbi:MAG: VanZ family protein, partial [Nocardioidaceae bacterium]
LVRRRLGARTAWAAAGLVWWLLVIALVTLLPASGPPGLVPASEAQTACSFDLGGPAPDGFWIVGGGQRTLNTALFVPAGLLLVLLVGRPRTWWLALPGVALLAAYSVGIEWTQLVLARLDRACDVTDVVDNVTGALLGAGVGALVAAVLAAGEAVGRRRR